MHAWFAAAADARYAVVVPIIGVQVCKLNFIMISMKSSENSQSLLPMCQGFRWAIDNDKWQARVDSIKPVFEGESVDICLNFTLALAQLLDTTQDFLQ